MEAIDQTPLISVIVPVYNVEKYLARCLDSIIRQSFNNLEIICVNDGSTDNSLQILKQYAKKDHRIRIIDKTNGGLSSARNAGLSIATGDFISFIDSDDWINDKCYEVCSNYFADNVDIVSFSYVKVYSNGDRYYAKQNLNGELTFSDGMFFQQAWNVCWKIFRASFLKKHNMYFREGILYEDLEFSSRLFLAYHPTVVYIQGNFYYYYQNLNSIMSKTAMHTSGMSIQHIYILDTIYNFLKEKNALQYSTNDFLRICEYCLKNAIKFSSNTEIAKCYAEMTSRLIEYNLNYENFPLLECICNGDYHIKINKDIKISDIRKWEKIFCIKNELGVKVIRIFGKRVYTF